MRTLRICAFIFLAALLFSCGGHRSTNSPANTTQPQAQTLGDALAELDALPVPDGVKPDVFMQLKAALREALECRARACTAPMDIAGDAENGGVQAPALQRIVSTPPTGDANRVDDLAIADNGDGTYSLTWHYRNLGDYNQDGAVGVSDITPLAVHYGETWTAGEENSIAAVVDGSGNGTVGVEDVTQIAMYFAVNVASYSVRSSALEWGAYTEIDAIGFGEATGGEDSRKSLLLPLSPELGTWYRVVPQDSSWSEGVVSDAVQYIGDVPPDITSVSPLSGTIGDEVQFSAIVVGATPFTYAWDFGGGTTPDVSADTNPLVVLGGPGDYDCAVIATNAYGEDAFPFTLTVLAESTYSVSGHIEKDTGGGLQNITLTLSPGNYSAATNSSGDYSITGVPNGDYTLTPSNAGWEFDPPTLSVIVDSAEVTGKDFIATAKAANSWHITIVDSTGNVGFEPSIAIVNGNPAISYYDPDSGLNYVRASEVNGATWEIPITVDSGGWNVGVQSSLVIVDGVPAISYYDMVNRDLKYVYATDANGATWDAPVTIDSSGDVGGQPSMLVINGNPAITYRDRTLKDMKYVRAIDESGIVWDAPLTVDSVGDVGAYSSLAVINGSPAICYFDWTNYDLKYVRANNASGALWNNPITVDSAGDVGWHASLAVVNGNPAISYYDNTNGDLKYVRANDANGITWDLPGTLDSAGNVGYYSSQAIFNGNPAVSYYDATNDDLKYVRANDVSGTSWDTSTTVDIAGDVGEYSSLEEVNGHSAICYYDRTNGDLKFAIYY